MSDIMVRFLNESYTFPEELKQYVIYCNEFEKINNRLQKELICTMKKKPYDQGGSDAMGDIESRLKEAMICEGKKVITMLSQNGIFDVTETDIINSNKGFIHYEETYKAMMDGAKQILIEHMQSYLSGFEDAQTSAYSQVTGAGISIWSNSILAHATLAAYEASTVKRQCAKADKDYEMAMEDLSRRTESEEERKYTELFATKVYPEIAASFGMYVSELMTYYLKKLQTHSMYDYSKVVSYDMKRSSELLNNILLVDDKKPVLIEAFKCCPYNPDIYAKVLEVGLCDIDTFKTAKEFYQDSVLIEVLEDYCKKSLHSDTISNAIKILADYKRCSEIDILYSLYSNELEIIKKNYSIAKVLTYNMKELDKWIRDNINQNMDTIINTSIDDVENKVTCFMDSFVNEKQFIKFADMNLLSIDYVRLTNSSEAEISKINLEIKRCIISSVLSYIEKARGLRKQCDAAYAVFNSEIKKRNEAIVEKYNELKSVGVFALSKKKELKAIIFDMESELSKYRVENEPKDLEKAYYRMYS